VPNIGNGVRIAGIVVGEILVEHGIEVLQIRQLALVQLQVDAGLDLAGEEGGGGNHDVIAALPREHLRFQGLVAVEGVVVHLDAVFLLEIGDRVRADIIGPVVDVEDLLFGGCGIAESRQQDQPGQGQGDRFHVAPSE
jgi:hypothetical protein